MIEYTRQQLGYLYQILKRERIDGRQVLLDHGKVRDSESLKKYLELPPDRSLLFEAGHGGCTSEDARRILFVDALDRMPLYINTAALRHIARWRLKIMV